MEFIEPLQLTGESSSCDGNEFITRNVVISESTLSVSNFRTMKIFLVAAGTCKNYPEPSGTIDWLSTTGGILMIYSLVFHLVFEEQLHTMDLIFL